jgi:DNA-binding CsgD family transcriptional regulator
MSHIIVFVNILILTTGFAVVYQGIQTHRTYRFPAVRSFVIYIALYNVVMLLTLIAQYLMRNVGSLSSDGMYIIIAVVMGFFGFTLAAIEVAMYAAVTWHLSGEGRVPRWFVYGYGLVCSVWLAAFVIGSYRFFELADKRFLLHVHAYINYSLTALFLLIPVLLVVRALNIQLERQRHLVKKAGLFFLSLACLDACGLALASPWDVVVMLVSSLALNVLLLLKIGPFVIAYYGPMVQAADSHLSLDRLCEEFRFSARERDVIQMIMKGKSNKEIEQELFISPHTVKNHIYHIFQKAGIKSRGQLVSMILTRSAGPARENES